MMALVFALRAVASLAGSILNVLGQMSTNTGIAFSFRTAFVTAIKLKEGKITSSPSLIPRMRKAR